MNRAAAVLNNQIVSLMLLATLTLGGAYLVSRAATSVTALVVIGLAFGIVAFLRTEVAIYLIIVAMLLSPEIGMGEMTGQREKGITLRFEDYLLVIVGTAWFLKAAVYKELNLLVRTHLNMPMALYAAACVLSTLLGMRPTGGVEPLEGSLFLLKYLEYFFLFWMVVNSIHDRKQIGRFLVVLFGVAFIVGMVAAVQIPSGLRVTAPFQGTHGEPNTFACYLLFVMVLALGVALSAPAYRWPLIALFCFLAVPFAYTLSRSAYVALAPSLFLLFFLTRRYLVMGVLCLAIAIALFSPATFLPPAVIDRITSTFGEEKVPGQISVEGQRFDSSTEQRLEIFQSALAAFREKPVFGWGITGWRFIDSQYFRVLVETGLVGFTLFLYLLYQVLRAGWSAMNRFRGRDPFLFGLASGFFSAAFGLMIAALGANVFIIVRVMEPFWLVCAMLVSVTQMEAEQVPEPAVPGARLRRGTEAQRLADVRDRRVYGPV